MCGSFVIAETLFYTVNVFFQGLISYIIDTSIGIHYLFLRQGSVRDDRGTLGLMHLYCYYYSKQQKGLNNEGAD